MIVRLLDNDTDRDLLIEAWHFRDTAPRWFRECLEIFKETLEEYLENSRDELHFAMFDGEWLIATIRMIPENPNVWNLHLSARKGTGLEELIAFGMEVRRRMPEGTMAYGYLPARNRTIGKLYEALGFVDSGLSVYKGVVHDKVVRWKHYWLVYN